MMDASTRRKTLATVAILAVVGIACLDGGYAFGFLSDRERSDASIRAASTFDGSPSADEVVSFRGCGQVQLRVSEDTSFALAVTLYDSSADTQRTVTVTDADAGSPSSGFWYNSGPDRYQFATQYGETRQGDRILAAEFDGESVENDDRCSEVETGATDRDSTSAPAGTTAGNTGQTTVDGSDDGRNSSRIDATTTNEASTTPARETTRTTATAATTTRTTPANTTTDAPTTTYSTVTSTTENPNARTTTAETTTTADESPPDSSTTSNLEAETTTGTADGPTDATTTDGATTGSGS